MSAPIVNSSMNLDRITAPVATSIQQTEQQIGNILDQIQNNPNISPSTLVIFQAQIATYTNTLQMLSSVVKDFKNIGNSISSNIGT